MKWINFWKGLWQAMNNMMLTGERQVGKSTLIQFLLKDFPGRICGFLTLPRDGLYYLSCINSPGIHICGEQKEPFICRKNKQGKPEGITSAFDDYGAKILENCLRNKPKPDLIVMDELGVFESEAYLFQEKVLDCLNSDTPVLGVIKDKPSPFLDLLRKRDDTVFFRITEENREQMKDILINKFYQFWK